MAGRLVIDKGAITATSRVTELAPTEWSALTKERRAYLSIKLPHDCRLLLSFVEDAELIYRECGYGSVDEYIRNGLELDPEQVRWAIDGLRRMKPDDPIPYARAMELGKHGGPREGAGRPKKGEEQETKNQVANRHSKTSELSSTSRVRILARLDRDGHAELAAKVRAGKLSANKAAIEAGFGKPSPTPAESILKHLPKLTPAQLRHVRARIDELLNHKRRAA